jgi:hypothetical protein
MRAGTSRCNITPPVGAPTLGTIQRSTGVHEELYARALVLDDGSQRIAIVCLDLIGMDFTLVDEICDAVRARTGIAVTLLNCSHTHSSPFTIPWSVLGWRWLSGPGKGWRDGLVPAIAELVSLAANSLHECILRAGRAPVQIGLNRRLPTEQGVVMKPSPGGIAVPWVDVLRVDRADESPAAILFSHAAHPVIIHGASQLISADFPGYATQHLGTRFGRDVVTMFAQACGAQINGEPLRGGFGAAEKAGAALADAAYLAARDGAPIQSTRFTVSSICAEIPLASLPARDRCSRVLQDAEQRLTQCCKGQIFSDDKLWDLQDRIDIGGSKNNSADDVQPMDGQPWWLMDNVLCLRDLMKKVEAADETPLRLDAHMLRFGDEWSLLTTSHELFAEYQHWFDENAPTKRSMMLAYTNGCESYIPTNEELQRDGYETASFPSMDSAALKYKHRRAVSIGVEAKVKEALRGLWA